MGYPPERQTDLVDLSLHEAHAVALAIGHLLPQSLHDRFSVSRQGARQGRARGPEAACEVAAATRAEGGTEPQGDGGGTGRPAAVAASIQLLISRLILASAPSGVAPPAMQPGR